MSMAFEITETMTGLHHFVDPAWGEPDEQSCHFRVTWGGPLGAALDPRASSLLCFSARGTIFVEGLTPTDAPCQGQLTLDYFRQQRITYDLTFAAGGKSFHYVGHKTGVDLWRPLLLIKTHTTCYGALRADDGAIVSRSVLHFEPATLWPFLASFRLRRAR